MKIDIENIGIIKKASLEIKGISLIAGKNDSGKSTVGKILYSILRSYNISDSEIEEYKINYFYSNIQSLFRHISRYTEPNIAYSNNFINKYLEQYEFFDIPDFEINIKKLKKEQVKVLEELTHLISHIENLSIREGFQKRIDDLKKINSDSSGSDFYFKIEYLKYFFEEFFPNGIKNVYSDDIYSKIKIDNFYLEFANNILLNNPKDSFYLLPKDVIYIESPHQLEKENSVFGNSKSFENYLYNKVTNRTEKIFSKKINAGEILENIKSIIKGSVSVENIGTFNSNLTYEKKNYNFEFEKIATGIKTFGIIELLLKNSSINEDTLLIIDEPEVHLHPSWQVKFAELLVLISKNINVQILLSSHSPYFIEALQSYSEKYDYTDQVNFYFADNDDYLCSNIYNSNNLSEVYDSISEAYYELKSIKPLNKND